MYKSTRIHVLRVFFKLNIDDRIVILNIERSFMQAVLLRLNHPTSVCVCAYLYVCCFFLASAYYVFRLLDFSFSFFAFYLCVCAFATRVHAYFDMFRLCVICAFYSCCFLFFLLRLFTPTCVQVPVYRCLRADFDALLPACRIWV